MEDLKLTFEEVLKIFIKKIKRSDFITWFKNSHLSYLDERKIKIFVSTVFQKNMIDRKYKEELLDTFNQVLDKNINQIHIDVDGSLDEKSEYCIDVFKIYPDDSKQKKNIKNIQTIKGLQTKILNPNYRLDNFVVGAENQLAFAAAQAVIKNPGKLYNPLFIYGGVGLGKTHLLQAIGNGIIENKTGSLIIYVTSEMFTNDVIKGIREGNMDRIRNKYRKVDALIIDDIQFLANKTQTQEEFFHTFNILYDSNKHIILSSDNPPSKLKGLEQRLISRFQGGMTVQVGMPDYETRVAILQKKCQQKAAFISDRILNFIASNITNSVRELEGILNQVIAEYELSKIIPSIKSVGNIIKRAKGIDRLIGDVETTFQAVPRDMNDIVEKVAEFYNVNSNDIIGLSREAKVSNVRHVAMYIAKKYFKFTYKSIGDFFGKRLHSTVMYSYKKVEKDLKKDKNLNNEINSLLKDMSG